MWTLHTANTEHWVPLATVASFKRMRDHTAKGLEWLAAALRARSDALEVDETGTKIRRTTGVKEPKDAFERSVYAVRLLTCWCQKKGLQAAQKGFGDEEPGLQGKLEEFFDQYGRTEQVRMRRDESKLFKVRYLQPTLNMVC
jgi:lupus La protein